MTAFTLDDLTLELSEADYKPTRREPKTGLLYEFRIDEASVEQSPKGHLQLKLVCNALDGNGQPMFRKWLNVPLPVSVKTNAAPSYAKGLWLSQIRPLFPEHAPYDRSEKDPVTGKKSYFKGDKEMNGAEFEEALIAANRAIGEMAKQIAGEWVEHGDGAPQEKFLGKQFFAEIVGSRDGKYLNVGKMIATKPSDRDVCYDKKEAMGG